MHRPATRYHIIKIGPLYDHLYARIVERLFMLLSDVISATPSCARARFYSVGVPLTGSLYLLFTFCVCLRAFIPIWLCYVCSYLILEKRKLWQHNDFSIIVVLQSLTLGLRCYNGAAYRIGVILLPGERHTQNGQHQSFLFVITMYMISISNCGIIVLLYSNNGRSNRDEISILTAILCNYQMCYKSYATE